jgi:hypothetical protein
MTQSPDASGAPHTAALETVKSKTKSEEKGTTMDINDIVEKGDYPGHPFHGNQYVGGEGGGKEHAASRSAHESGKAASDKKGHEKAAKAHAQAAKLHEAAGNETTAAYHEAMSHYHSEKAKHSRKSMEELEAIGIKVLATSEEEYRKILSGKVIE